MADLRIVAGAWRGRKFRVPEGDVRPTSDRVREAWLSIVNPALDGAQVVDLCAGSGALGLEALSRGAAHCDFVEQDARVRRTLGANIALLGASGRATVHADDALDVLDREAGPWDVAFADPPYGLGIATGLAERWLRTPFAAILGIEHEASLTLPSHPDGRAPDRRTYGTTALTFYRQT